MTSTSQSARLAKWLSVPLGLVISALLIWQASYAAFSDTVKSPDNTWTSGSVELIWADDGTPLFEVANLAPGDSESKDVTVTYGGTLDARVKFYGTDFVPSDLAKYIDLEVRGSWGSEYDETPGANGQIWQGTLADFAGTYDSYGSGIEFDAPKEIRGHAGTFRFTYTMNHPPLEAESVTSENTKIGFVLEARNR